MTYTELKAQIADFLNRTDLDASIPTFIAQWLNSPDNRAFRTREGTV